MRQLVNLMLALSWFLSTEMETFLGPWCIASVSSVLNHCKRPRRLGSQAGMIDLFSLVRRADYQEAYHCTRTQKTKRLELFH